MAGAKARRQEELGMDNLAGNKKGTTGQVWLTASEQEWMETG